MRKIREKERYFVHAIHKYWYKNFKIVEYFFLTLSHPSPEDQVENQKKLKMGHPKGAWRKVWWNQYLLLESPCAAWLILPREKKIPVRSDIAAAIAQWSNTSEKSPTEKSKCRGGKLSTYPFRSKMVHDYFQNLRENHMHSRQPERKTIEFNFLSPQRKRRNFLWYFITGTKR